MSRLPTATQRGPILQNFSTSSYWRLERKEVHQPWTLGSQILPNINIIILFVFKCCMEWFEHSSECWNECLIHSSVEIYFNLLLSPLCPNVPGKKSCKSKEGEDDNEPTSGMGQIGNLRRLVQRRRPTRGAGRRSQVLCQRHSWSRGSRFDWRNPRPSETSISFWQIFSLLTLLARPHLGGVFIHRQLVFFNLFPFIAWLAFTNIYKPCVNSDGYEKPIRVDTML